MLAKLTHDNFSDPGWIFERKFDGERALTFRDGGEVRLMSRNAKKINNSYPELVKALSKQREENFIIDGEIVAFEGNITSFQRLQHRMQVSDPDQARRTGIAVFYYVFDIVHLDGYDVSRVPLRHRKGILKSAFDFSDPIRFTPHRNEEGLKYFKEACRKGWEGLIAKNAESVYVHSRSSKWLKFKCVNRQEFVIGGYSDPEGSRIGFGALLLGYYDGGNLKYAGKVGTGFEDEFLQSLGGRLESLERKTSPFKDADIPTKGVHWVTPQLVGEVGFTEWTGDGKLRHPRFIGLRRDKSPKDVVREPRS